jgi:hypothetical protein
VGGEFVLLNSSRRTSLDIQIRKSSFAVLALVALTSNLCSVGTGSKRLWSYPHLLRLEHVLRRSLCLAHVLDSTLVLQQFAGCSTLLNFCLFVFRVP